MPSKACLTLGEAARALGVGRSKLDAMIVGSEVATVEVGAFGVRMVTVGDVERMAAR